MVTRPLWTIDELGAQVALALSVDYDGPPNGRVRDVPDRRTIRYYTTLGLLDRPAQMRGRTALYGRRHLLQLVAIKHLQSRGLTLRQTQEKLLGLTDTDLRQLAQLPDAAPAAGAAPQPAEAEPRRAEFWRQPAAAYLPGQSASGAEAVPPVVQGVRLDAGVTLLIESSRSLNEEDVEA